LYFPPICPGMQPMANFPFSFRRPAVDFPRHVSAFLCTRAQHPCSCEALLLRRWTVHAEPIVASRRTHEIMDDDDDVSGVKPLTIWQQKAVREAHGLELEKQDIVVEIKEVRSAINELEPHVNVIKDQLWEVRKKMGSYPTWVTRGDSMRELETKPLGAADAPDVSSRRIQRECELITRRTGYVSSKNDKAIGTNNEIKREIDLARREKIVFERVSQRMQDEMGEVAHDLRQLQYEIENLYSERDAAQLRMQDLKKVYEQDKHQFLKDYEDLTLLIDQTDIAIQKMQRQKLQRRTSVARLGIGKAHGVPHKKPVNTADVALAKARKDMEHMENEYKRMCDASGIEWTGDPKQAAAQLAENFEGMSESEFAGINEVNKVTLEYEHALHDVQDLNKAFKELMESNEKRNAERAETLSYHQAQFLNAEKHYNDGKRDHEASLEKLEQLFEPLHTTFFKIGCDKFITSEDKGQIDFLSSHPEAITISDPTTEVKNENYTLFLGILESRLKSLVHRYSALIGERKRQLKAQHKKAVLPAMPDMGPFKPHGMLAKFTSISAPSLKDNDTFNDDDILAATNGNVSLTASIRAYQTKLGESHNASRGGIN